MSRQPKASEKRDSVILEELFRDIYRKKYTHLNGKNSPMMLRW